MEYNNDTDRRRTTSSNTGRSSSSSAAARRQALARKKARRREVMIRRAAFGTVCALVLILIILLIVWVVKKSKGGAPEETTAPAVTTEAPADTTPAGSEGDTTADTADNDTVAPVITGTADKTVTVGDTVSYKSGVTVTDDHDPAPVLDIDSSAVDLSKAGTYQVVYTAKDASGNTSTVTITVTVQEKNEEQLSEELQQKLQQVKTDAYLYLKQIKKDAAARLGKDVESLTKAEIASEIWLWVNWNLDYTGQSDKSSWILGAYQYFETHKGDCFTYFAASKALLDEAGIENVDIWKSDTSHSSHYWNLVNLGDGWYHFDATPRDGGGDYFFMVTDEQLDTYSAAHENSHIFDHDAFPERATKIITDLNAQPAYQ